MRPKGDIIKEVQHPVFWPARQERGCRAATLSGALAERRAPRGKQRGFDKLPLFSGGRTSQIPGKDEAALHWAADAQRPVTGMRDLLSVCVQGDRRRAPRAGALLMAAIAWMDWRAAWGVPL